MQINKDEQYGVWAVALGHARYAHVCQTPPTSLPRFRMLVFDRDRPAVDQPGCSQLPGSFLPVEAPVKNDA